MITKEENVLPLSREEEKLILAKEKLRRQKGEIEVYRFDWPEYIDMIEALALGVYDSGYQIDQIICVSRGGLLIGEILSRMLKKPLGVISSKSYDCDIEREGVHGITYVNPVIAIANDDITGHVLIVDDIADSGISLMKVAHTIHRTYPDIMSIQTAVLIKKDHSAFSPDHTVRTDSRDTWFVFPAEKYDSVDLNERIVI
jgi:hypoxanthine phosphoribosyltransferase